MEKWRFVRKEFNGKGESQQPGSIRMPNGAYFCAVESTLDFDEKDEVIIERVLKVLNRELPNGKPRNRKGRYHG